MPALSGERAALRCPLTDDSMNCAEVLRLARFDMGNDVALWVGLEMVGVGTLADAGNDCPVGKVTGQFGTVGRELPLERGHVDVSLATQGACSHLAQPANGCLHDL